MKLSKSRIETTFSEVSESDIRLIRIFVSVVNSAGFTAAQEQLNISQSTISTHMSELERRLDMRLCERGRSGFSLTENGELVFSAAKRMLSSLEEFRSEVLSISDKLVGTIDVGVLNYTITDSESRFISAVRNLKEKGHDVNLDVTFDSSQNICRKVKDGRLHVGIATAHHKLPRLVFQPLYEEQASMYCAKEHPLFDVEDHTIDLAGLKEFEYVARGYEELEDLPAKRFRLRPRSFANNVEGVLTLILSGKYIGYLPVEFARKWLERETLRPLLPETLGYSTTLNLVMRKHAEPAPVVQAFIDEIKNVYDIHPASPR